MVVMLITEAAKVKKSNYNTGEKLKIKLKWKGKGLNEKAYNKYNKPIVECDKNYFRPLDVNTLLGNSSKAKKELKWKPKININMLIDEMIENELKHIFK